MKTLDEVIHRLHTLRELYGGMMPVFISVEDFGLIDPDPIQFKTNQYDRLPERVVKYIQIGPD